MIDREKVINALMCWRDAAAFQKWTGDCDSCAFANSKTGDCIDIAPIIDGAIDLLKADQYYLQKLTERLQLIADIAYDYDGYRTSKQLMELIDEMRDIASRGLPEVKDD